LAGLIIPHDNGLSISIVEKIEDLVSILFLPIVSHSSSNGLYSLIELDMLVLYVIRAEHQSRTA